MTAGIEGIRLPSLPKHPTVRTKTPAPFRRPRITIGSGAETVKREWRQILAADLAEGDTVPGVGLLHQVNEAVIEVDDGRVKYPQWNVWVTGGEGGTATFSGTDSVLAFVPVKAPADQR